jgi:hypothetical protein
MVELIGLPPEEINLLAEAVWASVVAVTVLGGISLGVYKIKKRDQAEKIAGEEQRARIENARQNRIKRLAQETNVRWGKDESSEHYTRRTGSRDVPERKSLRN